MNSPGDAPPSATPLWGGRFEGTMDGLMVPLNRSLGVDGRLWREDVRASIAWAEALERAGVLTPSERATLVEGLRAVSDRIERDGLSGAPDEDIHSVVERLLGEAVGDVAGKLHTGRSRNDQSATGFRMYGMAAADGVTRALHGLATALLSVATEGIETPMPGYTHLQQAQPLRVAHWALAHVFPLLRDAERVAAARGSASVLPLGSGALAGCAFPVDRDGLCRELGFSRPSENSLDAVSDRDWVCDFAYAGAMVGMHLSRLAEDLVLFSSREFGFVRLSDGFSTGSSLMPQKRNPDVAELARGKSGRLVGNLNALIVLLKGLPTGYNRDLQEDKQALFDTVDTLLLVLPAMAGAVGSMEVRAHRTAAAMDPQLFATDVADHLVRRGVPFRRSHEIVGRLVRLSEVKGVPLSGLSPEDCASVDQALADGIGDLLDWNTSVEARAVPGGTAARSVAVQIDEAERRLGALSR